MSVAASSDDQARHPGPEQPQRAALPAFRFYDNAKSTWVREYLQRKVGRRTSAGHELSFLRPTPPALRFFDPHCDAIVLSRLMRRQPVRFQQSHCCGGEEII